MKPAASGSRPSSQAVLWLPPFFVMAGIFIASSGAVPSVIRHLIPYQDKLAHFFLYGVLGFLLCRAAGFGWGWPWRRAAAFAVLVACIYGLLDEWHQSYVPGRTVDVGDWIADTLGACAAQIRTYFSMASSAGKSRS